MAQPALAFLLAAAGIVVLLLAGRAALRYVIVPARTSGARRCPVCRSSRIRPSWPRSGERWVPWLQPMRCEACLMRFYVSKRRRPANSEAALIGNRTITGTVNPTVAPPRL